MDYRFDDLDTFDALMAQTEKFRISNFQRSLSVRTNIDSVYGAVGCNPVDGHVTHVFALFSSGSLFKQYTRYYIAADYRLDQQFAVHPYGSNSVTNRLISNENGSLITCNGDVSRAEKANILVSSGIDLTSLSICVNYKVRPKNCGVCSKCIRTKVMFYANSNVIPDIFIDNKIPKDWYKVINVKRKIDRVFLGDILDVLAVSERRTELDYQSAFIYWKVASIRARTNPFFSQSWKSLLKIILPKTFLRGVKKLTRH